MTDEFERAFMQTIDAAISHKDDNSDLALINRAAVDFRRNSRGDRLPTTERDARGWTVEYETRHFDAMQGPSVLTVAASECFSYTAVVALWEEPRGRIAGKVVQRPDALHTNPDDPLIRYLLETGAVPNVESIYRRAIRAVIAANKAGVKPTEIRFSMTARLQAMKERENSRAFGFARDMADETYLGLKIIVEREAIPANWGERKGDEAVPIDQATVCVAGIGKLGRWFYFEG